MHINENFLKLKAGYLFPEIGRRVTAWTAANPEKASRLIRCGIGDVTEPLPLAVRDAMHAAVDEQGVAETFHGYRNFNRLLEDMRDRGLLEIQKEEKSGGYLILGFGPEA